MKNKTPNIKLIYACGLIPLLGGLGIFFAWWVGRAYYAKDFNFLEEFGFNWIMISFLVAIVGLFVGLNNIYTFKKLYRRQTVFGMLFILTNIPVLNWVLTKQSEIETRTYLKFINKSGIDVEVKIIDERSDKIVGKISSKKSIVDYYVPMVLIKNDSSPVYDSIKIIVTTRKTVDTIQILALDPGDCKKVYLDKDFNVIVD